MMFPDAFQLDVRHHESGSIAVESRRVLFLGIHASDLGAPAEDHWAVVAGPDVRAVLLAQGQAHLTPVNTGTRRVG
eukprot:6099093-Alexandrium_andersonii.AAC.1